ncbi:hypothetical protein H6G14_25335 [Nostoc parmelioides FACHB-3921]|uniref:Uncharacterized protein n=1 Tax=Nostoc parmelioides FACHB-3921 TaxID=2692909 RepID=A0ABR8BLM8_9NOSO|nr:hypothetical protein [Nostoc parmelioides FACHB-3921]
METSLIHTFPSL